MKIFLTGKNLDNISALLRGQGFTLIDSAADSDIIITYGGDGAMLGAERDYPGKLKYPIRDASSAPLCPEHQLEKQLDLFAAGKLKTTLLPKLEGTAHGMSVTGINDIFIHNRKFVSALRYEVSIDGELYAREIVGDGIGVSTVHGSTAYYRSITHSIFRTGIGLAFSNSAELVSHLVLPESACIKVRILRGPAGMVADNSDETIELTEGDTAQIRLSSHTTPILGLDIFMCPQCRALRHKFKCLSPSTESK